MSEDRAAGSSLLGVWEQHAECLVTALKPHYDDLLDDMEYRQEWRSRPGYTGFPSG